MVEYIINAKEVNSKRTLFLGWNEGIKKVSESFGVEVPTLQVQYTLNSTEAIIIHLMDKTSNEGYDGYTNLFYDQNGKIQKAFIRIYNVDELNNIQLKIIIRHELGHALGLGHTNSKNDLMQSIINMNYNAISMLDLKALAHIYYGYMQWIFGDVCMANDTDNEDSKSMQELILELYMETAKVLKKIRWRV